VRLTLTGVDDEHHPDDGITDEFIREHVRANACDATVSS
jgi:hypothetical protein